MRLRDPRLRDLLAAEYVLGTLSARARRRFQSLMRYDAGLRAAVDLWQAQLGPLAVAAPALAPPDRVWAAIQARIQPALPVAARSRGGFWRGFTFGALALLVVAVGVRTLPQPATAPAMMIAVLEDEKSEPAVLLAWPMKDRPGRPVEVRVVTQRPMPSEGHLQLWLIPSDDMTRPIPAGMVASSGEQHIRLAGAAGEALSRAWGFAISVEPPGGSPTGQPSGPVLFKGPCARMI